MLFAITTLTAFAQADFSLFLPKKYPVPEWVKPGLVVIYQHEGGSQSGGGESAVFGNGFRVDIITNVEENGVYGVEFVILISPATYQVTFQPFRVLPLPVFLHPDAIQDLLDQADVLAQRGIIVRGGRSSDNSIWVSIEDNTSSTGIWVSSERLVQRFQYLAREQEGSGVVKSQYLKHLYIDWPGVNEFPFVARESHTYDIYISSYGITSPAGSVSYEVSDIQGEIAQYEATQYSFGVSLPLEDMGVPSFGPFYVCLELLKKDVILEVPEIGLVWQNEQSDYGVDSVVYLNGQECFRASFDEEGILVGVQYLYGGFVIMAELVE